MHISLYEYMHNIAYVCIYKDMYVYICAFIGLYVYVCMCAYEFLYYFLGWHISCACSYSRI